MGKEGVHNLSSQEEFNKAVTGSSSPLMVLDCMATWCGPCKVIAPKVVELSQAHPDVMFYKLDIDEVPDVAQTLAIRAMPTFVLFKDGEKVDEVVGANLPPLEAAIKKALA